MTELSTYQTTSVVKPKPPIETAFQSPSRKQREQEQEHQSPPDHDDDASSAVQQQDKHQPDYSTEITNTIMGQQLSSATKMLRPINPANRLIFNSVSSSSAKSNKYSPDGNHANGVDKKQQHLIEQDQQQFDEIRDFMMNDAISVGDDDGQDNKGNDGNGTQTQEECSKQLFDLHSSLFSGVAGQQQQQQQQQYEHKFEFQQKDECLANCCENDVEEESTMSNSLLVKEISPTASKTKSTVKPTTATTTRKNKRKLAQTSQKKTTGRQRINWFSQQQQQQLGAKKYNFQQLHKLLQNSEQQQPMTALRRHLPFQDATNLDCNSPCQKQKKSRRQRSSANTTTKKKNLKQQNYENKSQLMNYSHWQCISEISAGKSEKSCCKHSVGSDNALEEQEDIKKSDVQKHFVPQSSTTEEGQESASRIDHPAVVPLADAGFLQCYEKQSVFLLNQTDDEVVQQEMGNRKFDNQLLPPTSSHEIDHDDSYDILLKQKSTATSKLVSISLASQKKEAENNNLQETSNYSTKSLQNAKYDVKISAAHQQMVVNQNVVPGIEMDRFIPYRSALSLQNNDQQQINLQQARFEAASQNQSDHWTKMQIQKHKQANGEILLVQATITESLSRPQQTNTSGATTGSRLPPSTTASSAAQDNSQFGGPYYQPHVSVLDPMLLDPLRHQQLYRTSQQQQEAEDSRSRIAGATNGGQQSMISASGVGGPNDSQQSTSRTTPNNNSTTTSKNHQEDAQYRLLKSYNFLLEHQMFSSKVPPAASNDSSCDQECQLDDDMMRWQTSVTTNLTTDIDRESSGMQGLSLLYQTNKSKRNSAAETMMANRRLPSLDEDEGIWCLHSNENQTSSSDASSALLTGKILRYRSEVAGIVESYEESQTKKTRGILRQEENNPLRSLDYLTADSSRLGGSSSDLHFQSLTSSSSASQPMSSDNILINKIRKIGSAPYKILDAPNLCDDFYLNLVDWSSANTLAVALAHQVYIWNANTSSVQKLVDLGERNRVTSVAWSQKGTHLSVGTYDGHVQIWDVQKQKLVRTMAGHLHRVSASAWSGSMVASGSKDKQILVRDVRAQSSFFQHLRGHKQEVCGLRWSPHDHQMLASGGNDNKLMIWDVTGHDQQPLAKFSQHQAAVKAINWSPLHRGLLATGGGTADQHIRFWNTLTLQPISAINTGSQVCNLVFSKTNDELVSTHGYSLNQIIVWKYPTMEKIATLTGHTFRVLYLAMSPDGSSIVTGAGDETLRFWNIFPKSRSNRGALCGNSDIVGSGTSKLFPSNDDFR